MSYTYTSTNRFFIENPYNNQPNIDKIPFTSQQLLDHLNSINPQEFNIGGSLILAEYAIDGKYNYPVIAFSHNIFTPSGKIKKSFKQSLQNKSFTDDYVPSNLWEQPYDKKGEKM